MAIPSASPTAPAGPSLAGPVPSLAAGGELLLPGPHSAWTYAAAPHALMCRAGEIVPRLAKAWHQGGFSSNLPIGSRGEGMLSELATRGYQPVPLTMACVAWGKERKPESVPHSTYLDRYEGRGVGMAPGSTVVYWSDAWHRPVPLGIDVTWEFDGDGWLDFLLRVRREVLGLAELTDLHVRIAVEPAIRSARRLLDRTDPRGVRQLMALLMQIPAAHLPPDLLERREKPVKPSKGRRGKSK